MGYLLREMDDDPDQWSNPYIYLVKNHIKTYII